MGGLLVCIVQPLTHSLTHYVAHSVTHSLTHSLTHSPTHLPPFPTPSLSPLSQDVKVRVSEEAVPSGQRLFFNSEGEMTDSFDGFLNFSTTDDPVQKNVTVYVKVHTIYCSSEREP